ncbi:MAG: helix-turn-helix domain-containing protein [Saprospiraceae bacterium]
MVQVITVSRTQLFSKIRELTGLTPYQYIQQLRTKKVHQVIQSNTYDSIHQIIQEVRFKRLQGFEIFYKKIFRISPVTDNILHKIISIW